MYITLIYFPGLGYDDDDLENYYNYYVKLGRDPTDIELFDLAQSNSEHSRHWLFNVSWFTLIFSLYYYHF